MIRAATAQDVPRIVEMGQRFHTAASLPMRFDAGAVAEMLSGMVASDSAALLVSDYGMIGGVLAPAYCDPAWVMAVELFWWADRDGLALLRAFETWGRENGAHEIRMTSLAALPRADAILRRKGYAATEISYAKVN